MPDHDGKDGGVSRETARAYTLTIWGIALGILVFAIAVVLRALAVGNPQLFKDGVDWVYDVALYGIAALVFGRDARAERVAAFAIGAVMAVAGLHTLYDLADKIATPRPIEIWTLGFSAGSAVVIAVLIVAVLWRFRREDNPVIKATWLSSRNDVISTTGFALLGLGARVAPVRWPEYLFDLFVAGICFQATWAIWRSLRRNAADPAVQNKAATGQAGGL
ncbi:cation efflux family protein [Bosea sp. 124]|nr:cation efflux family protein [Bosea sp. 124]